MTQGPREADLRALGLGPPEVRAYLHLRTRGPCTAGEVADRARIHRSRAYGVLDALEAAGLVEVRLGEPRRYVALPLDATLEHRLADVSGELEALEDARRRAATLFQGPDERLERASGQMHSQRGRRKVLAALARALMEGHDVRWLTTPEGVLRLANHQDGWDAIQSLQDDPRNVRVLLVRAPGPQDGRAFTEAQHLLRGMGLPSAAAPPGLATRMLTSERLLIVHPEREDPLAYRGDDLLLDTTIPALRDDARDLFDRLWDRADPGRAPADDDWLPR